MTPSFRFLLLSCLTMGLINLTTSAASTSSRAARMTLSGTFLKLSKADFSQQDLDYQLAFTSTDDETFNGELYRSMGTGSVGSQATLSHSGSELLGPLTGPLELGTPLGGDINLDGITDFLEVSRGITNLTSSGTLDFGDGTEADQGTVAAKWNRSAGSATGTVLLKVDVPGHGLTNLTFSHTFEIFQYTGTLTYDIVGTNISTTVNLPRIGASGAFMGPMPMYRISPVTLGRAVTRWKGPGGLDFTPLDTFGLEGIEPTVNYIGKGLYGGLVVLEDGDPSTPFPDEFDFFDLIIFDPNDSNANGISDLSDLPTSVSTRPTLLAQWKSGKLSMTVNGPAGTRQIIERTDTLTTAAWAPAAEATLDSSGFAVIDLGTPSGEAGLFRVRTP
jgi:hypothetical protein